MTRILLTFLAMLVAAAIGGAFVTLGASGWRWVNGAAVLLGGLGIVVAAGEAWRLVPKNTLPYAHAKATNHLGTLRRHAASYVDQMAGNVKCSLGQQHADYVAFVGWIDRLIEVLNPPPPQSKAHTAEAIFAESYPDITAALQQGASFPGPTLANSEILQIHASLAELAATYAQLRTECWNQERSLEPSALEQISVAVAPHAIALATALAFASTLYAP